MRVRLGGAESIGQSWDTDLEFKLLVRSRAELRVESPSRMTLQRGESGLFGDRIGIADQSGIGVTSNRSRSSRLESEGVECVAESHGGPGDRRHEEGLPQRMFESKQVIFANLGARIAAIASSVTGTSGASQSRHADPQATTAHLSCATAQGFEIDSLDKMPELLDRNHQYIRILWQEWALMRLRIEAINKAIEAINEAIEPNQEAEREITKVEWGTEDLEPDK